jgi:hypothetical protein
MLSMKNEKILIWPFQHSSISVSEKNSNLLLTELRGRTCALIIPFDSVSELCYKNLIDFSDSVTLEKMKEFYSITGIRYVLIGKLLNKSEKTGIGGPYLYEYEKDIYYPFPNSEGRWITYVFELHDFVFNAKTYTLTVKVEAVPQDFEKSSGDVSRKYPLASTNLNAIALKKGIKKLKRTFNCENYENTYRK